MLNTMHTFLALLHPAQAPHLHADEPGSAMWLSVAVGLAASVAAFLLVRRMAGSRNSAQ